MNVGSLFSGIGGLDLGLERAGMTVRFQSEIDPYASRVLAKHWPDVPNLGDITTIDWSTVELVDLICGGYPCQPFSIAGNRAGVDDARHLWPHMLRAIRVLRPRFALLENVPGHLSLGFGRVLGDLAESGYDAEWDCIPAAAVGAPHRRDRVFIVARTEQRRDGADTSSGRGSVDELRSGRNESRVCGSHVAHTEGRQQQIRTSSDYRHREPDGSRPGAGGRTGNGSPAARTRQPQRGASVMASNVADTEGERRSTPRAIGAAHTGTNAVAGHGGEPPRGNSWAVEPDVGRVAHGIPSRVDRLRCLGNAVVPQVAEWIGHRIMAAVA